MNTLPAPATRVMGILNVTPDSFSDGGLFVDSRAAIEYGLKMVADGAEILDLGAESTRPKSHGVEAKVQLERLLPVLRELRAKTSIELSIDTRSAEVAAACLNDGATMINDVSALRHDPKMVSVLRRFPGCNIILMHMQGTPETMQQNPVYDDVVVDIMEFFLERISTCACAEIETSRIWLDPGFGFGKTLANNVEIVQRFNDFSMLKCPLVAGVSRKSFLGTLSGVSDPKKRDIESIVTGLCLARNGASVLRVHDVPGHVAALKIQAATEPRNTECL